MHRPLALLFFAASPALAADGAGARGFFVAGGVGLTSGTADATDGVDAGTWIGTGGHLQVGEELIDGLTLGLQFQGAYGAANGGDFDLGMGSLLVDVGWRPFAGTPALQVHLATGLGGGEVIATGEGDPAGAGVGAVHALGLSWDFPFGDGGPRGAYWSPSFRWVFVPPALDTEVGFSVFTLGVDFSWYAGRG